ncbi:hypothetical protein H2O64_16895 [Kordia sp. YSTF-M3]|uniref:Bacteriocin n=1 Tax=Kordia aestuariivivens TaxID=2759037 RepID=A0ABR7QCQ8_9FLAO|nr:hypothetical protein [Kordia aestuariivivens]MBC8756355.1 hypothetical protein [Kordia aestuariivivens]
MKKNILNIKGVSEISKEKQSQINGGIGLGSGVGCGCDCAGRVTGPFYCQQIFGCPQVYTCDDSQAS